MKKETKGDMEKRMKNALILVPRDKDYQGVFFDDKWLRLEVTDDFAVVSTMFHSHVFHALTANGISRPYAYTKRFIEIALANDCMVKDARGNATRSYGKLMAVIKDKEDKSEYNLCWYYDLWLNNIFHPLYGIGEDKHDAFLVYEQYMHTIARQQVIFMEKTEDVTNKKFITDVTDLMNKFASDMEETVVFEKLTDEERKQQEVDAMQEVVQEKQMEESANAEHQQ